MVRDKCGGCGSDQLHTFLDLGQTPLAGDFVTPDSEPQMWLPLSLGVCEACWLVQQMYIVEDEDIFNEEYGSTSGFSQAYHRELVDLLIERHDEELHRGPVVEIGANDGDLLTNFVNAGYKAFGVDPAGVSNYGPDILNERFTRNVARKIKKAHGEAGMVIAKHVVDRVIDLDDFFAGISALVHPLGIVIIETPYLGSMLLGNQFGSVMHERRYHFSLDAISKIAERYGLFVENAELVGGDMRLTLGRNGPSFGVGEMRRGETWLAQRETYDGVQGRVNFIKDRIVELVEREKLAGRRVAAYGATNEGMTLLLFAGLNANKIEYIVDPTQVREGTASPGFYIPVVGPGVLPRPDTYVLLAWDHLGLMLRAGAQFLNDGGQFLVPLPYPTII